MDQHAISREEQQNAYGLPEQTCRRSQKRQMMITWAVIALVTLAVHVFPDIAPRRAALGWVALAATAFNLLRAYQLHRGVSCGYASPVIEVGLITALVWFTGGALSPFTPLYLLPIAAAGPSLGGRGMLIIGLLASLLFQICSLFDKDILSAVSELYAGTILFIFLILYTVTVSFLYTEVCRTREESDDLAANAREVSQLYEEAEARNREISALQGTIRMVAGSLNLSEVLPFVAKAIVETLGFNSAMICLVDRPAGVIEAVQGYNVPPELIPATRRELDGPDILADIVRSGKVEVISGWDERFHSETFERFGSNYGCRVFAPISLRGEVLGVVEVGKEPGAGSATEHELEVLQSFLDNAAVAIGNARQFEEAQRQMSQLRALTSVGTTISTSLDLKEIMDSVVKAARSLTDSDSVILRLLDDGMLVLGASDGIEEGTLADKLPDNDGLGGMVLQAGDVLAIPDLRADPRVDYSSLTFASPKGMVSYVASPLMVGGETLGILAVYGKSVRTICPAELEIFRSIANQAAVAIKNARHFESIRRQMEELRALTSVSAVTSSSFDVNEIMNSVVEAASETMGTEICMLRLLDGDSLVVGAYRGFSDRDISERIASDHGIAGTLIQTREPLAISDLLHDPQLSEQQRKDYQSSRMRSYLGVPLIASGEIIGILGMFLTKTHQFTEGEISVFSAMASQAAVAIKNARHFSEIRGQMEQLKALTAVSSAISSSLQIKEIMSTIVEAASELMNSEICSIRLLEGDELVIGAQKGLEGSTVTERFPKTLGLAGVLVQTRTSLMIPDLRNDKRLDDYRLVFSDSHLRSFLGAPLIANGELVGILGLYGREVHHYTDEEMDVFNAIANQAAVAIANARLYEQIARARDDLEAKVRERTRDLAETNERMSAILSAISDGIALVDRDGRTTWVNEVEAERFGSRENVLGRRYDSIYEGSGDMSPCNITFQTGQISRAILSAQTPDGETRYYDVIASPIYEVSPGEENAGGVTEVLQIARDITENRRMEEKLAEYTRKLEQMVEERTAELQRKNEELESFVFTVSHDLKAPIVSIQGFAANLAKEYGPNLEGDGEFYIQRIRKNTEQLQSLIQELLELSRIGRLPEPWEKVSVQELVGDVVAELQFQIENNGIKLDIQEDLPEVICQRKRFRQVFVNLIDNAIHYRSRTNPPFIRVASRELDDCWEFRVQDNGAGIAPENQRKIFQIFQRLHKVPDAKDGAGVGLAIVKKIVETHGGQISVESEGEGYGSTFIFTVPKRREDVMDQAA